MVCNLVVSLRVSLALCRLSSSQLVRVGNIMAAEPSMVASVSALVARWGHLVA